MRVWGGDRHDTPDVQAVLDQHALDAGTSFLESMGYAVVYVSGFRDYQLRAIRDGDNRVTFGCSPPGLPSTACARSMR